MVKRGVDSEQIMREVRGQIAAQNRRAAPLPFADEAPVEECATFDEAFSRMERTRAVCRTGNLSGGGLSRFLKRIVRKCTRFFVVPVAEDAERFHVATLQTVEALEKRVRALEKEAKRK